ncbi:hypothetical protein WJX84_005232 [Apatococcus fuscideae]|uniref:Malate dehydrogenase n=1 Tax=Apatococcus fuscideae TaxID=2026836 RepID=A0AAW1TIE2_9CHLO
MSSTSSARRFQLVHLLAAGAVGALGALLSLYIGKRSRTRKEPVRVLITGAAGQIGYALSSLVGHGELLGKSQPVILHLLDIGTATEPLNGLKLELVDSALPLLTDVIATTNLTEACTGVSIAIMVGGYPRKTSMERKDVMAMNGSIYKMHASALEKYACKDCKVVVVANPANTNALILSEFASSIPRKNITCLTRLDHNRALGQVAAKLAIPVSTVKNVTIWGNHSSTQYPDVNHGIANGIGIRDAIKDDDWLDNEFVTIVQQRGAAIIKARNMSSALSAASSVCDHIRDWVHGTPPGHWVSMGVLSDGSYGVPEGLCYSFPVTCQNGDWSIVQGLPIDARSRHKMDDTARELEEERQLAREFLQDSK